MRAFSIRDEYDDKGEGYVLTLWEGAFASSYMGTARYSDKRQGYNITLDGSWWFPRLRAFVKSPKRGEETYLVVDDLVSDAAERRAVAYREEQHAIKIKEG